MLLIFLHSQNYVNHIGLKASRHPCINIKIKVPTAIINGMAVIKQGKNINRRFKCFLTSKSLIIDIELINIVTKPIQSKMLLDSNSVTGSNEDT